MSENITLKDYDKTIPLIRMLDSIGIVCPEIAVCQFIDETSVKGVPFKSKIFRENNNLCGMKYNDRGHAIGIKNGHANYNSVLDCLLDYRDWQKQMLSKVKYPVTTNEEYLYFLEHLPTNRSSTGRYAENPTYIPQLRKHLVKLKRFQNK